MEIFLFSTLDLPFSLGMIYYDPDIVLFKADLKVTLE